MLSHYLAGVVALSAATGFIFPPAPSKAEPPAVADPAVKKLLEDIKTQITSARNELAGMKDRLDLLDRQMVIVQSSMATTTEVAALKKQLEQIQADADRLRAAVRGGNPSVSGSSPLGAGGPGMQRPGTVPPPAGGSIGTFRITNHNAFDTEVIVSGTPYLIAPNATKDVSVPAGWFTYAVPTNIAETRTRYIAAGQVFSITIHP